MNCPYGRLINRSTDTYYLDSQKLAVAIPNIPYSLFPITQKKFPNYQKARELKLLNYEMNI